MRSERSWAIGPPTLNWADRPTGDEDWKCGFGWFMVRSLCIYEDDRDSVRGISRVGASQLYRDCVRWGLDVMNRQFAVFGACVDAR